MTFAQSSDGCNRSSCDGIRTLEVSAKPVYDIACVLGVERNAEEKELPGFVEVPTMPVTSENHIFSLEHSVCNQIMSFL